uniref:HDC19804 n=1 Tax=Drosophila melanogaster TaxID=7227 RepID=Q6II44_DROME|nr:TPA_inf: HDC19804 [Drosophila melanogaster]
MFIADFRRSQLAKTLSLGMGIGIGIGIGIEMGMRMRMEMDTGMGMGVAFELGASQLIYSVTEGPFNAEFSVLNNPMHATALGCLFLYSFCLSSSPSSPVWRNTIYQPNWPTARPLGGAQKPLPIRSHFPPQLPPDLNRSAPTTQTKSESETESESKCAYESASIDDERPARV